MFKNLSIQFSSVQFSSVRNLAIRFKPKLAIVIMGLYSLFLVSCGKDQTSASSSVVTPLAGESCFEDATTLAGCNPVPSVTFNVTNLPGYPGCTFPVTVDYCVEYSTTGDVYLTVGNYTIGNHTCQALIDSLLLVFQTPTEIDDNAFIARFDNLMFPRLEDYLFAHFGGNISCKDDKSVTVSFIKQACNAICFYQLINDKDPKDGSDGSRNLQPTNFVRTSCSTDGCCRRETKICFNPDTNTLEKETFTSPYPGNITPQNACSGGSMIPPTLPEGATLIKCNACTFSCE